MTQKTLLKIDVPIGEVTRKPTLGKAIEYCAELAGFSYDKSLEEALRLAGVKVDATQLTRWRQGGEGIRWDKFTSLMDVCGNDAPLLWMLHQRGYDVHSLRLRETETERKLRLADETIAALQDRLSYAESLMLGRRQPYGGDRQAG